MNVFRNLTSSVTRCISSQLLNMKYFFGYLILTIILVSLTMRISLFIAEGPPSLFWPLNGVIMSIIIQSGGLFRSFCILLVGCVMTSVSRFDIVDVVFTLKLSIASFFEILLSLSILNYFIKTKEIGFLSYEFLLKLFISVSTISCIVGALIGSSFLYWDFLISSYYDSVLEWFLVDLTGNFITLYTFFSIKYYLSNKDEINLRLSMYKIKNNNLCLYYILFVLVPFTCTYYIKSINTIPSIAIIMSTTPLISTMGLVFENIIVSFINIFVLISVSYGTSNQRGPIYNLLLNLDARDNFICVEMVLLSVFILSYIFSILRNFNIQKQGHLTKLLEEKDIFFSYISHELRTPLSIIYGYTENLLNHGNMEFKTYNDIKCIMDASTSMKATINDLLLVFNIEEKSYVVNIIKVDTIHFCNNILSSLLQINDKNLKITLEINDDMPEFIGTDPVRLRQLILNVGSNAIKYTNDNGFIELSFCMDGDNIKIKVKDNGVGISENDIDNIFERFFRSDSTKDKEGIGLGLPMCKNICKVLHGEIYVESKIGIGSVFTIIIPNNNVIESRCSVLFDKKDMSKYEILIVEDSILNSKLLERILHIDNYTVEIIRDGSIVMEKIVSGCYDMVLLDLGLPGRDGIDILKDIKYHELPSINTIPVVIISAEVGMETRHKCIKYGCLGFLDKPFDESAIRSKLYDYLEKKI